MEDLDNLNDLPTITKKAIEPFIKALELHEKGLLYLRETLATQGIVMEPLIKEDIDFIATACWRVFDAEVYIINAKRSLKALLLDKIEIPTRPE